MQLAHWAGLAAAAAILWAAWRYRQFYKKEHLVCPKCGHCWKPPLGKMLLSVNAAGGKIIRCPACGEKEYMEAAPDTPRREQKTP